MLMLARGQQPPKEASVEHQILYTRHPLNGIQIMAHTSLWYSMELLQILTSRFVIPAALEGNPKVQNTQMQNLKFVLEILAGLASQLRSCMCGGEMPQAMELLLLARLMLGVSSCVVEQPYATFDFVAAKRTRVRLPQQQQPLPQVKQERGLEGVGSLQARWQTFHVNKKPEGDAQPAGTGPGAGASAPSAQPQAGPHAPVGPSQDHHRQQHQQQQQQSTQQQSAQQQQQQQLQPQPLSLQQQVHQQLRNLDADKYSVLTANASHSQSGPPAVADLLPLARRVFAEGAELLRGALLPFAGSWAELQGCEVWESSEFRFYLDYLLLLQRNTLARHAQVLHQQQHQQAQQEAQQQPCPQEHTRQAQEEAAPPAAAIKGSKRKRGRPAAEAPASVGDTNSSGVPSSRKRGQHHMHEQQQQKQQPQEKGRKKARKGAPAPAADGHGHDARGVASGSGSADAAGAAQPAAGSGARPSAGGAAAAAAAAAPSQLPPGKLRRAIDAEEAMDNGEDMSNAILMHPLPSELHHALALTRLHVAPDFAALQNVMQLWQQSNYGPCSPGDCMEVCVPEEVNQSGQGPKKIRVHKQLIAHLEGVSWLPMPPKETALTRLLQIQLRCASSTSESSRTEALSAAFVQELPMQPDSMPLSETVQMWQTLLDILMEPLLEHSPPLSTINPRLPSTPLPQLLRLALSHTAALGEHARNSRQAAPRASQHRTKAAASMHSGGSSSSEDSSGDFEGMDIGSSSSSSSESDSEDQSKKRRQRGRRGGGGGRGRGAQNKGKAKGVKKDKEEACTPGPPSKHAQALHR
ncbi:hypothetical protein DUNSADRAFT_1083 [Dunaliella salina]|uniref:E3 ubiquitin-protein ligase n=1 Tax=Dunaliella salina TaxID=3046 RepID=A0ABQ7GXH8_DUNSA|nr:hypothetical protein DUNSADRAFT_1083 [Dunaliella salina]|eukprot:KAF5839306.1 hypothetical protein DUNSADRAFT_1083 [Dunaliella salina]